MPPFLLAAASVSCELAAMLLWSQRGLLVLSTPPPGLLFDTGAHCIFSFDHHMPSISSFLRSIHRLQSSPVQSRSSPSESLYSMNDHMVERSQGLAVKARGESTSHVYIR